MHRRAPKLALGRYFYLKAYCEIIVILAKLTWNIQMQVQQQASFLRHTSTQVATYLHIIFWLQKEYMTHICTNLAFPPPIYQTHLISLKKSSTTGSDHLGLSHISLTLKLTKISTLQWDMALGLTSQICNIIKNLIRSREYLLIYRFIII